MPIDEDEKDRLFTMGSNAAWARILGEAVRALGPDGNADRWRLERAATVSALRGICEHYGDNDWSDDLHLADVIEKHLHRHLECE